MLPKRKADSVSKEFADKPAPPETRKKQRIEEQSRSKAPPEEDYNIIDRQFYPPQMSSERCHQYTNNEIPRPIELLHSALEATASERKKIKVGEAVVHWFKSDTRIKDNTGLCLASEKAKEAGVPLICMYIISPQDFQAHMTAPVRVDFILRNLQVVKDDLAKLDIPLYVETVEARKKIPSRIFELCEKWGAKHLFANIEYEVDELRREAHMVRQGVTKGIEVLPVHDTCVVAPGKLQTGGGKQYAVYTPWYRSWMKYLHANQEQFELFPQPAKNPSGSKEMFKYLLDSKIPEAPENKTITSEEKKRFQHMWPAGEHEAQERLDKFLKKSISKYKDERNFPAVNGTAMLSAHFSAGTLSARSAIAAARTANSSICLDTGDKGIVNWISEVAWRDFYKHVLVHWPYVCMNKPFKPEYTDIEWDYSEEKFSAWCQGRTGYPIIDAAMRQMLHMGYMHNRCRMIVASFLAKDLLQDWRMGERFFMERLIDGDFASNNGGWGFSASTGVDPQPYFRIFNPLLQSEKFDPKGEYIKKWVPELAELDSKKIHDPFGRGGDKIAKKNGYPEPIVSHKESRDKALAMYKRGLGKDTT